MENSIYGSATHSNNYIPNPSSNPILVMSSVERSMTDYQPNCQRDLTNIVNNGMRNTFEYRQWLQQNGNTIINYNLQKLESGLYK